MRAGSHGRQECSNKRPTVSSCGQSVIYAEISVRFSQIEELDLALPSTFSSVKPFLTKQRFSPANALSRIAGRRIKASPLPDFFIGAHAAVTGYSLRTRDTFRHPTYFSKLILIASRFWAPPETLGGRTNSRPPGPAWFSKAPYPDRSLINASGGANGVRASHPVPATGASPGRPASEHPR